MKAVLIYLAIMAGSALYADQLITHVAGCATEEECAGAATPARVQSN